MCDVTYGRGISRKKKHDKFPNEYSSTFTSALWFILTSSQCRLTVTANANWQLSSRNRCFDWSNFTIAKISINLPVFIVVTRNERVVQFELLCYSANNTRSIIFQWPYLSLRLKSCLFLVRFTRVMSFENALTGSHLRVAVFHVINFSLFANSLTF